MAVKIVKKKRVEVDIEVLVFALEFPQFTVVLDGVPQNHKPKHHKIGGIKTVRHFFGLGLADAKQTMEDAEKHGHSFILPAPRAQEFIREMQYYGYHAKVVNIGV